jgi:hypothetical protein
LLNIKTIVTLCCEVSPVILGSLIFSYLPKPYRILLVLSIITLVVDGIALYIRKWLHQDNGWLYNFYMLFDCGLLTLTGHYFRLAKPIAYYAAIAYIIFFLSWSYSFFALGIRPFFVNAYMAATIALLVMYILLLYYHAMEYKHSLTRSPLLWVCLAVIIFYACNAPFFSIMSLLNNKAKESTLHYLITTVLNNIRYLFITYSFYLVYKQHNATPKSYSC